MANEYRVEAQPLTAEQAKAELKGIHAQMRSLKRDPRLVALWHPDSMNLRRVYADLQRREVALEAHLSRLSQLQVAEDQAIQQRRLEAGLTTAALDRDGVMYLRPEPTLEERQAAREAIIQRRKWASDQRTREFARSSKWRF